MIFSSFNAESANDLLAVIPQLQGSQHLLGESIAL